MCCISRKHLVKSESHPSFHHNIRTRNWLQFSPVNAVLGSFVHFPGCARPSSLKFACGRTSFFSQGIHFRASCLSFFASAVRARFPLPNKIYQNRRFSCINCRGLYATRSVLTLTRSVSEGRNLFPRLRFGLVCLCAAISQSGPRGVYSCVDSVGNGMIGRHPPKRLGTV